MRAKVLQAAAWVARQIRALRDFRRTVLGWLRDHASHCVASVWLAGMTTFGVATVHRAVAAQVVEPPTSTHPGAEAAVEAAAMLDVDEINGIRINRLHALGLEAAGDSAAPDERTTQDARASLARGIDLDGEQVATAGKIVVVTRGGIAGWLKRNRGKKADPETLAWLRGQEAAEGSESYAGWADRDDANILNWSKERRHAGAARTGAGGANAKAEQAAALHEAGLPAAAAGSEAQASAGSAAAAPDSVAAARVGSAAAVADSNPVAAAHTGSAVVPVAPEDGTHARPGFVATAGSDDHPAAATPEVAHPRSPQVQGVELFALGSAATSALIPRPPVDPSPDELAALRERIRGVTSTGAIAVAVRDHHVVLLLMCDQLFEHAGSELTTQGAQVMRELGHLLAGERSQAYTVAVDPDRAFELVSRLAIAGLAPERIEIALKKLDSALDVVELEWIAVKDAP